MSLQFKYEEIISRQKWVKFNPNDPHELVTNASKRVLFLKWEPGLSKFQYYSPENPNHKDYGETQGGKKGIGEFTKTVFMPGSNIAVTGDENGYLLVWDRSLIIEGVGEQSEKRLSKIVHLGNMSINTLMIYDRYLVCGNSNGSIRFYDQDFKVVAWFEDIDVNQVKSISFSIDPPVPANPNADQDGKNDTLRCSDFIVADSSSQIVRLSAPMFEEIEKKKKQGTKLLLGINSEISAIAVHPHRPILAIAGSAGYLVFWDYMQKKVVNYNFKELDKNHPAVKGWPEGTNHTK